MVQEGTSHITLPDTGETIYTKLEISSTKRWKNSPPDSCPDCGHADVQGVEILGAIDGPLFWECSQCGDRFLRFTKKTTIAYLDKTKDLYIDLEGFDRIWEQIPN